MDEQRLERALRAGPPFATPYAARPLPLEEWTSTPRTGVTRLVLQLAVLALLLLAIIAAALVAAQPRAIPVIAVLHYPDGACGTDGCPETLSVVYAGGREERIFPPAEAGPVQIREFAWSVDGKQLALVTLSEANEASFAHELYVIGSDGSHLRLLKLAGEGWCLNMAWSPRGTAIACVDKDSNLVAIDVDSGESTVLMSGTPDPDVPGDDRPYRWSPNGEWLAYSRHSSYGPYLDLWVMRRDGSDRRELDPADRSDAPPSIPEAGWGTHTDYAWSPDSDAIAFVDDQPGGVIEVVDLGGARSTISPPPGRDAAFAIEEVLAWSADDELTFRAEQGNLVGTTALDGTAGQVLVDYRGRMPPWMGASSTPRVTAGENVPWVSPDGRTVWWWETTGESRACLMAAQDGGSVRLELCVDEGHDVRAVGEPHYQ